MPKQKGSIDLKTSGYLYGQISSLESQVDGQIQTWAQDTDPASNWSADEKATRVGDLWLFTGVSDNTTIQQGLTLHPQGIYKYVYDSANSIYKWEAHSSTNNNIFDLADGKKRVFYGTTLPPTPYDENDVWVQGENGDIKVCRTARSSGSGTSSDWTLASKYTDDSTVTNFINNTFTPTVANLTTGIQDAKVQVFNQNENPANSWTNEDKPKHEGDMWYCTDSTNTTYYNRFWVFNGSSWTEAISSPPQSVINTIASKGTGTIFTNDPAVSTPSNPREGDLWFKGPTYPIETYINGSWVEYNKYTDDSRLDTFLTQYSTDQSNMQGLIEDSKLETYYQSSDPSSNWSTSNYSKHEGDLWYYTGTTTSTLKQNATYRWNGTQWEQQDVPKEVFDQIDGKKNIYYTTGNNTPDPPYEVGDLWSNGTDIKICKTQNDTNTYRASDWTLASNYTDDSVAETKNATFVRPSSTTWPTATKVGDLCIDTYNNNRLYRWNGSSWSEVSDKSETAKIKTKTQYALSTSDSSAPSDSSFNDDMPEVSSFIPGPNRQYLWVRECMSYDNGSSWSASTPYKANTFNGLTLFANSVKGDDYTEINGSTIKTGRIQDSTGKNFIQIANNGTTTAGHLEFKDTSDWGNANQGIQWNSSQGQLNIKGHITAKSLTIDGTGGSYNAYDAINISGYNIEITTEPATAISANNVYLYPHLYHNGTEVDYYILTEDTEPDQDKTYYYYDSTEEEYIAYTTKPSNPKTSGAYESLYSKFIWFLNDDDMGTVGDEANRGRTLATYSNIAKVTFTFNDGATDGGEASVTVNVDPSKYITRISDTGIEIAPENKTGNDKLAINGNSIDIYRNNVSMLHLEDSSGRFGTSSDNTTINSQGISLYQGGANVASFSANSIQLGKNSTNSIIDLCNGTGIIKRDASATGTDALFMGGVDEFILTSDASNVASTWGTNSTNYIHMYNIDDDSGGLNSIDLYTKAKYLNLDPELDEPEEQEIDARLRVYSTGGYLDSEEDWIDAHTALSLECENIEFNGVEVGQFLAQPGYFLDSTMLSTTKCTITDGGILPLNSPYTFCFVQLAITATASLSANSNTVILSGFPRPLTGGAALSVGIALSNSSLTGKVNADGDFVLQVDDVAISSGSTFYITGMYIWERNEGY